MELLDYPISQAIVITYAVGNFGAFVLMGFDKGRSRKQHNAQRLPEGVLFFSAGLFGSLGIYLGMLLFRHKTKKWYFQIGIPLLLLQNLATLYLLSGLLP